MAHHRKSSKRTSLLSNIKDFLNFHFFIVIFCTCLEMRVIFFSLKSSSFAVLNPFVHNAPFPYPWKHQKTFRFSDAFRESRKGALGTNGLRNKRYYVANELPINWLFVFNFFLLLKSGFLYVSIKHFWCNISQAAKICY